jgi:hypothetical protein
VRPFSGLRAPRRGPLGSREIAGSRRTAQHLRASPSRAPRDRRRASGRRRAVAVRLLARHQRRELERLRDRHPSDLSRGHLGEDEVVAFQRPPEDRSSVALRGRRSSSRGRDGLASLEGTKGRESLRVIRGERSRAASRAHAPSPRGVSAPVVSLKPLGSRTKIRLSLGKFQPLRLLASRASVTPQNVRATSDLRGSG